MDREKIQEEDLMGQLREKGIGSVGEVRECYLEGNGSISVTPRDPQGKKA